MDSPPLNYDGPAIRTSEQIDVLWLKGRAVRPRASHTFIPIFKPMVNDHCLDPDRLPDLRLAVR